MKTPSSKRAPALTDETFEHEQWPFYWLTQVVGRYLQLLEGVLKTIGLDVPRWRVLMLLHGDQPSSVSELAQGAIIKLPTMTKIVQRMQADGLLQCRVREADARVTEVTLTDSGHEARRRALEMANRIYQRSFGEVRPRELEQLNRTLREVFDRLQY